jgi:hypothetical protein
MQQQAAFAAQATGYDKQTTEGRVAIAQGVQRAGGLLLLLS